MLPLFCLALALLSLPPGSLAAFGLTTTTSSYTVDTGGGLVFSIRRTDSSSTTSIGDISSFKINGVEYQDQSRGSQLNSGFDYLYTGVSAVALTAQAITGTYKYIKITVSAGNLTHYYIAKSGDPTVYMGTYAKSEPNTLGLIRYIARLKSSLLSKSITASDISSTTSTVEASDVFALSNGQTRSKHYSNSRLIDWTYYGATNTAGTVGVYFVRGNFEGSSGGPFYRCLRDQGTSTDQELTLVINYGEIQTESMRNNVLHLYALTVTSGSAPTISMTPQPTWMSELSMTGFVAAASRGKVVGVGMSGTNSSFSYTVGFANSKAQYWVGAILPAGNFVMANMIPGTYTMTVYQNELSVYTSSVTVTAGSPTTVHTLTITNPNTAKTVWRIGTWDGTPLELLNGKLVTYMHPSDPRMSSWTPGAFYVGKSTSASFPAYLWNGIQGAQSIYFKLTSAQLAASATLRIGLTIAYISGRPRITVNNWTSSITSASSQPSTRSLTVGSYRGNNVIYSFTIPASAWQKSASSYNLLQISIISGSSGSKYLSPGVGVDAIELISAVKSVNVHCTVNSTLPTGASAMGSCSANISGGSSCSYICASGYTAVTGICSSSGTWTTSPSCTACTPTSTCGSRTCGSLWNGCATVVCGNCTTLQYCNTGGTCTPLDSISEWQQMKPDTYTSKNWNVTGGLLRQINNTLPTTERYVTYRGNTTGWFSDYTTATANVMATSGTVGFGLRMNQQGSSRTYDYIGWKAVVSGSQATGKFCFMYGGVESCTSQVTTTWKPTSANNFTVNLQVGSSYINSYAWLNGNVLYSRVFTIASSWYPSTGYLFFSTLGNTSKTFSDLTVRTKTTVHVTLSKCMEATAWNTFVASLLGISTSSVSSRVLGEDAMCSGRKRSTTIYVDSMTASTFETQIASDELSSSTSESLVEILQQAISDGADTWYGISVTSVEAALPDLEAGYIVGVSSSGTAMLSTGAIVGIAVGGSVAACAVAGAIATAVVAVKRKGMAAGEVAMSEKPAKQAKPVGVRGTLVEGAVDVMNNPEDVHSSITNRAPPTTV